MIAPRFLFRASAKHIRAWAPNPGLAGEGGGGLVSVLPTIPYNKLVRVYDPTEIVVYLLKHISTW